MKFKRMTFENQIKSINLLIICQKSIYRETYRYTIEDFNNIKTDRNKEINKYISIVKKNKLFKKNMLIYYKWIK